MKFIFSLLFLFNIFPSVWAASPPPVSDGGILPGEVLSPQEGQDIEGNRIKTGQTYLVQKFLPTAVSGFVVTILFISVVMIIIAGLYFIFSSGETETKQKAKDIIFWAIVGAALAILSFAIVKFVIGINFSGA